MPAGSPGRAGSAREAAVAATQTAAPLHRGDARARVVEAALDLFAEHGVSGTSLQMIADRLGVTKAAVYKQFPTKEEIVQTVIEPGLSCLAQLLDQAETVSDVAERVDLVLTGVVDLIVANRRVVAVLRGDPVLSHLDDDSPVGRVSKRLLRLLEGPSPSVQRRVAVTVVLGGTMLAGTNPELAGLSDDELRAALLGLARETLAR